MAGEVKAGDRLELLWAVDGQSRWWGCKVNSVDPETQVLSVLYDAFEDFPPQETTLKVVGEHYIHDLGVDEGLPFRKEGEDWGDVVALDGEGEAQDEDEDGDDTVVDAVDLLPRDGEQTMQEVLDVQNQVDPGGQLQALGLEELGKLDPAKQRVFAEDYGNFKAFLSDRLRDLVHSKGKGYTVQTNDINSILLDFKQRQSAAMK